MEQKKFGNIYKITSPTGKVYIGQTFDMNRRYNEYKRKRCKAQGRLYNSIVKHGFDAHRIEVLFGGFVTAQELTDLEEKFISEFNSTGENGLNVLASGAVYKPREKTGSGRIVSEETRKKISDANKGKFISPFSRMKMSINNAMRNPENVKRMKAAIAKPEVKRKMSEIQKRLKAENNPLNKPVLQYNFDGSFVAEYISASEAARKMGTTNGRIADCCRGARKTHKGFLWRYK